MAVNFKNNNKGVILITVVIFVMIISILAASALYIMTNDARLTEYSIRRIQANYAAQAGIQQHLELLKTNPTPPPQNLTIDGITVVTDMVSPCLSGASADCIQAQATY